MLLDLRSLVEAPAIPIGMGGGASGNDFTPAQLRRAARYARGQVPPPRPYLHPRRRLKPAQPPAIRGIDPAVAHVLYELGEIDELELTALLSEVTLT